MKEPFIYPEPNLYKTTYGNFDVSQHLEIEQISLDTNNAITWRKLEEADIATINNRYLTNYSFAELGKESYVIVVSSDRLDVAATGESGFFYALNMLKKLINAERTIKNGILFYHPYKALRQVCMNLPNQREYKFFVKVLGEIADLKYNSIVFKNGDSSDLPQEMIESIADQCRGNKLQVHFCQHDLQDAHEAAFELDASSVVSWELRSKFTKYIEETGPAKVSYFGELSEAAMIQDGAIFRLVMGSYALNHFEFANSTWEKVLPLAMERTYLFMCNVKGVGMPSRYDTADRYPILVRSNEVDIAARKSIPLIHFNEQMTIADFQESSDSIVIRHSVRVEKGIATSGEIIGYYLVHYANGDQEQIDLIMDQNISCETVKWNHEFNLVTHQYDTDKRLHRVSCHTRPHLHSKANSQVVTLYDFEWINPRSDCEIHKIAASVTNPKYFLSVYRVENVVMPHVGGKR